MRSPISSLAFSLGLLALSGCSDPGADSADPTCAEGTCPEPCEDSDQDGVCDDDDLCRGDDASGDSDSDGRCDDRDKCAGADSSGDSDEDGVCDDSDVCQGDDSTGDTDRDGVCNDADLCVGFDGSLDDDGDGICGDIDLCMGDDASGDTDGDLVCDDTDPCPSENPDDPDGDGICGAALDCEVDAWTSWSACSVTCGNGIQERTRNIVTQPANGGAACPSLVEQQDCHLPHCEDGFETSLVRVQGGGGSYVQLNATEWVSHHPGNLTFHYTEKLRDAWTVYLDAPHISPTAEVRLDMWTGQVNTYDAGNLTQIYTIDTVVPSPLNGFEVTRFTCSGANFMQLDETVWFDNRTSGVYQLTQTYRDETTIRLTQDILGGVVELDVPSGVSLYNGASPNPCDTEPGINGLNVREMLVGNSGGYYKQVGLETWEDANGSYIQDWRTAQSVYLWLTIDTTTRQRMDLTNNTAYWYNINTAGGAEFPNGTILEVW